MMAVAFILTNIAALALINIVDEKYRSWSEMAWGIVAFIIVSSLLNGKQPDDSHVHIRPSPFVCLSSVIRVFPADVRARCHLRLPISYAAQSSSPTPLDSCCAPARLRRTCEAVSG